MIPTFRLLPFRFWSCFTYQGCEPCDEAERALLEDVRESIDELVQVVKTYQTKSKFARVMTSSLFKKRLEEAEAVINMAIIRLQVRAWLKAPSKLLAWHASRSWTGIEFPRNGKSPTHG